MRFHHRGVPILPAVLSSLLSVTATLASSIPNPAAQPQRSDALPALLHRMDRFLREHEVDGVTMDWRYEVSPSEEIRQTVVCQVLAYAELHRIHSSVPVREEIERHADFLLGRLEEIRSHSPFDGMLAYALLAAYEATGESRFLDRGQLVERELESIPTSECVLNGGLMVAMATAKHAQLTGDEASARKTRDIVAGLASYQNADGSFPHWCRGSRDIHYTGWMAMELIHVQRMNQDPLIQPMLERMERFLAARTGPDGKSRYEEPCPGAPRCTTYYDSRRSGCAIDYDTRGWTVEPAYCALVFDRFAAPEYGAVMRFLLSLENDGSFADLYDYWPPPEDPEYPWTIADTSVVNSSIIFWALATALSSRIERHGEIGAGGAAEETRIPLTVAPNPLRGGELRIALAEPGELSVHDVGGRLIRRLRPGFPPGDADEVVWDGRDEGGREVPNGIYFVRLREASRARAVRVLVAR